MPPGVRWYDVGSFFIDGMPGSSAYVGISVARQADGPYWLRATGEETQVERFDSATDVVDLVEAYRGGLEALLESLDGIERFSWVCLIARQRLGESDPTEST